MLQNIFVKQIFNLRKSALEFGVKIVFPDIPKMLMETRLEQKNPIKKRLISPIKKQKNNISMYAQRILEVPNKHH